VPLEYEPEDKLLAELNKGKDIKDIF